MTRKYLLTCLIITCLLSGCSFLDKMLEEEDTTVGLTAAELYGEGKEFLNLEDFNKIVFILMNQFGAPNSTMKKDWGASFEWNLTNAQLILTSNKTQHIILIYIKQS